MNLFANEIDVFSICIMIHNKIYITMEHWNKILNKYVSVWLWSIIFGICATVTYRMFQFGYGQ